MTAETPTGGKNAMNNNFMNEPLFSWCINTYKSLPYLKLAIESIRENAFYKKQPIICYTENDEETAAWLQQQSDITAIIEYNKVPLGIGGGTNKCIEHVKTDIFSLIHSDFYISKNYDKPLFDLVSSTEKPLVAGAWRLEPNIFNNTDRIGTVFAPVENGFGVYHHDFLKNEFLDWADEFVKTSNAPDFRKVEGVSYMMRTKYFLNNSDTYKPTSYEDMDQSVRMQLEGYNFVVTGKALTWHFGARSSHFLGQHDKLTGTSDRQKQGEARNYQKWLKIWGEPPSYDEVGFIKVSDNMREIYNKNRDKYLTGDYSSVIKDV
jgi:GT2 family glycosyltransferase